MPLPGFVYASGPWELDRTGATVASTAIAVLDALEQDSGQLSPAATNEEIVGVALEAKASGDATTNPVQILFATFGRTKFRAPREAGTLAAADRYLRVDLNSADGLDADTTTNGDFAVYARIDADTALGCFTTPFNRIP